MVHDLVLLMQSRGIGHTGARGVLRRRQEPDSHEGAGAVAASAANQSGVDAAGGHRVVVAKGELRLLLVVACAAWCTS